MAEIPIDFLKKIVRIELQAVRLVEEMFAGKYRSVFRGRGLDFEEVREYTPGDEIRHIDWNVSARQNDLFVKVYREERELTVMIAVDISRSGLLGSSEKSKREIMAEAAAIIAFSAIANNDRVGLLLFSDKTEQYVPPGKGRRHGLRIIRDLLFYEPKHPGTSCEEALRFLSSVTRRGSMVFFMSDFLDEGYQKAMRMAHQHFDLIPALVVDPRERELPDIGHIALQDAETGEIVEINTSDKKMRQQYAQRSEERLRALRKSFITSGMDMIELGGERKSVDAFREFFGRRLKQQR